MLKICANSCRRARWDARLGYHSCPQPPPLPLSSLFPDGGHVGCIDVVIVRIYPTQYMERTLGGGTVFRSERADHKVERQYDAVRQRLMERIYTKLQAEFEKRAAAPDCRRSRRSGRRYTAAQVAALSTGQEMEEAAQAAADPGSVEDLLTDHQRTLLTDFRRSQQEELHREMEAEFRVRVEELEEEKPKRDVVPLVKIRLAGCSTRDIDTKTEAMLTIWRPTADVLEMLTEGKRFHMYNLGVAEARGRSAGRAMSLTAQRMTCYRHIHVDDNFLDIVYEPREVVLYAELVPGFTPLYGEVDAVGVVIHVSPMTSFDRASGDEGQVQTVYLADDEHNLVSVTIWGSLTIYGLEEVLKVSALVTCANLQWRGESRGRGPLPTLTLSEATVVSANPKEQHLRTALDHLRTVLKAEAGYVEDMKEQLHKTMATPRGPETPRGPSTTPHRFRTTPFQFLTMPQGGGGEGCRVVAKTPVTTPTIPQRDRQRTNQRKRSWTNQQKAGSLASPTSIVGQGDDTITLGQLQSHSSTKTILLPKTGEQMLEQDGQQEHQEGDEGTHETLAVKKEALAELTPQRIVSKPCKFGECHLEPASQGLKTPVAANTDDLEVDPVVTKKRALQRMKARKLSMFADDTPVTPLNSNISVKAWKAFKMPTPLQHCSTGPARDTGFRGGSRSDADNKTLSDDQPGRKLVFEEEEPEMDIVSEKCLKRSASCVETRGTLRKKFPKTLPDQTLQATASSTKRHVQEPRGDGGNGKPAIIPQTCDMTKRNLGEKGLLLGNGKPVECGGKVVSETVRATSSSSSPSSSSAGDDSKHHAHRLSRTRGSRQKRRLSSENLEDGRPAKRPASLGMSRRKLSKNK